MLNIVAIIQARTGSTRLPGKVMYPLDGQPVLDHVVTRTARADSVDKVVVATSTEPSDEVIAQYVPVFGANVIRGSESNVLSRFERVIKNYNPEIIVRVTGDCPLISPRFIDACINRIQTKDVDYVNSGLDRTFPRGIACEAFTVESFEEVSEASSKPRHREHVTPYYREHPEEFELYEVQSTEVFDEEWLHDRTDIRLTLDEPADYQLLETVYREVAYENILDIPDVVRHIDQNSLAEINTHVEQKSVEDTE